MRPACPLALNYKVDPTRFNSTIVSVSPNLALQVIALYGPPPTGRSFHNAAQITTSLLAHTADLMLGYAGPSILAGDLNLKVQDTIKKY